MDRHLRSALALLAIQIAAFPLTHLYGLYSRYEYTDIVLHILSGMMLGFFWLWLTRHERPSLFIEWVGLIAFAVFGSFLWELWEFGGHLLIPGKLVNYIPTLSDTLGDMASGLLGAIILCLFRLRKR